MFTQPQMCNAIKAHPPTLHIYTEKLVKAGVLSADTADQIRRGQKAVLEDKQQQAKLYVPKVRDAPVTPPLLEARLSIESDDSLAECTYHHLIFTPLYALICMPRCRAV